MKRLLCFFLSVVGVFVLTSASPASAATETYYHKGDDPIPAHLQNFAVRGDPADAHAECDLILEGEIEFGDSFDFAELFDYNELGAFSFNFRDTLNNKVMCLNSSGGDMDEALRIAEFVTKIGVGLETRVIDGDTCTGACAILFLSGARTQNGENYSRLKMRAIVPTAKLGVHASDFIRLRDDNWIKPTDEEAYSSAIGESARIFSFSQHRDTAGDAFMNPYLVRRMLETPPNEPYYIDTVGDALLADLAVIGIDIQARLNEDLIETICDNVFMLDDGMFHWGWGDTWKRDPLASVPEIVEDFNKTIEAAWIDDVEFNYDIELEKGDGHVYGYAKGYRVNGEHSAQDCLVKFATYADIGEVDLLARQVHAHDASTEWGSIQVMTGLQLPAGTSNPDLDGYQSSPHRYWQRMRELEFTPRDYPKLIAYPFTTPLADLPRIREDEVESEDNLETAALEGLKSQFAGLDCEALEMLPTALIAESMDPFGEIQMTTEQFLVVLGMIREVADSKGCQ